jgi:hypothetical protein
MRRFPGGKIMNELPMKATDSSDLERRSRVRHQIQIEPFKLHID